jgi:hypothetical protein
MAIVAPLADCASLDWTIPALRSRERRRSLRSPTGNDMGSVQPNVRRQRSGELVTQSLTLLGELAFGPFASGQAFERQAVLPPSPFDRSK